MTFQLTQRPDHVAHVGDTVMLDDDPYVITEIKPLRESGVFLDWGQRIESNVVVITVERLEAKAA